MKLKRLNPTSPGIRHKLTINKNSFSKNNKVLKFNLSGIKKTGGHSTTTGHTTVWHKGGGTKRYYRHIACKPKNGVFIIIAFLYDPNRTATIAIRFNIIDFSFDFIIATNNTSIGSLIESGTLTETLKPGCVLLLEKIPAGSFINSVYFKTINKTIYARSAGTAAQLLQKTKSTCRIKLPSGIFVNLKSNVIATLGFISNKEHSLKILGKAGVSRHLGRRPTVRGVAMNPVDHPHGGRTNGGRPSVSPWGKLTKGVPTKKKYVKKMESITYK